MQKFDDSQFHKDLTLLGQTRQGAVKNIECFPAPPSVTDVEISTDEITAFCPLTKQPDYYAIRVNYSPREKCIESKAFKLYMMTFRDTGHFIEAFAKIVLDDLVEACDPWSMRVWLEMKPRGGIKIAATAAYTRKGTV